MFHKADVAVITGSKVQLKYPWQGLTKRISPTIETVRAAGKSVNIVAEVLGQFWLGLQLLDVRFSLSTIFVQTFVVFVVIQI